MSGVLPSPRAIAGIEAAYFIGTGVWPLVHRASFERLTGEKTDFWLVRTVGGLAAAAGLAKGVAAARGSNEDRGAETAANRRRETSLPLAE